jgi:transcriptional regulator with XRE-family HTH domain
MTGAELGAHRKAAGLTQTQLARAAGIGRHAVSSWETKASVNPWSGVPKRMLEMLGVKILPTSPTTTRPGARAHDGVLLSTTQIPSKAVIRQAGPPSRGDVALPECHTHVNRAQVDGPGRTMPPRSTGSLLRRTS